MFESLFRDEAKGKKKALYKKGLKTHKVRILSLKKVFS